MNTTWTVQQLAQRENISERTVFRRLKAGHYPGAFKDKFHAWQIPVGNSDEPQPITPVDPEPTQETPPAEPPPITPDIPSDEPIVTLAKYDPAWLKPVEISILWGLFRFTTWKNFQPHERKTIRQQIGAWLEKIAHRLKT